MAGLSIDLWNQLGIKVCGMVNPRRIKITEEIADQVSNLELHKPLFYKHESVLLSIWKDYKRTLYNLSTIHDTVVITVQRNKKQDAEGPYQKESVNVPIALSDYNEYMGGVDLFNQKISYYAYEHRSAKWYKRVFYYFLEVAIINSYIIYTSVVENKCSQKEFREKVIEALITTPELKSSRSDKKRSRSIFETTENCKIERTGKQRDCVKCSKRNDNKNKRKTTIYICKTHNCSLCLDCYFIHEHEINIRNESKE